MSRAGEPGQVEAQAEGELRPRPRLPSLGMGKASGPPTALGDFGDPRSTTPSYALCVLDDSSPRLVAGPVAPAGGTCAGRPCWRLISETTLEYRNSGLAP